MINTLHNMTDESILTMEMATDKRVIFLMKVYAELANLLHFINPLLSGAVSLRLADLTLRNGLTPLCPLAFVYLGMTLVNMGTEYIAHACRLGGCLMTSYLHFPQSHSNISYYHLILAITGRLALKLADRGNCSICKSSIIVFVYQSTLFTSVPLQAVIDAFRTGSTVGERSGDILHSTLNHASALGFSYLAGVNLSTIKEEIQDFRKRKTLDAWINTNATSIDTQCNALQQGSNEDSIDSILVSTGDMIHQINQVVYTIQRVFLFRRIEIITLNVPSFLEDMKNGKHPLRPVLMVGIFFDGLVAFQCARRAMDKDSREKWYKRGVSSSKMLLSFSVHSELGEQGTVACCREIVYRWRL
jgi:hypothetical protein